MRNLLVVICLVVVFGQNSLFAGTGAGDLEILYTNDNIEFTLADIDNNNLFTEIVYTSERNDFSRDSS